jgi:hypothetical protein
MWVSMIGIAGGRAAAIRLVAAAPAAEAASVRNLRLFMYVSSVSSQKQ